MSYTMEEVSFTRDCDVVMIPDGFEVPVAQGTVGWVTQVLGGNYTVQLDTGRLVRVSAADADAIGKEPEGLEVLERDGPVTEEAVWDVLRTCYDPEIPLDIVELGLVYACSVRDLEGGEGKAVDVVMTLTAPGCGMGQVLADDVERRVKMLSGVEMAHVELVFEPPWSPERMSEAGRLELGFFF